MKQRPKPARGSLLLLGLCAAAYEIFRLHRRELPAGLLRDCFPSLLLPVVMFSLVDLRPGIRFRTAGGRILIFSCTLVASIAWFEVAIPAIYHRSTGDWKDGAAMVLGFLLYLLQDFLKRSVGRDGRATAPVASAGEAPALEFSRH